jgi:hypothetical protein
MAALGTGRELLPARALARLLCGVIILLAVALAVSPGSARAGRAKSVWLCLPTRKPSSDPCKASREATVVTYEDGVRKETLQKQQKTGTPPIDCFYVYPTVSEQDTINANLEIEPQETQIAIDQASRFSQDCKVYAPVYPQLTLKAINSPTGIPEEALVKAYAGVVTAWQEYLSRYNKGRGVVLIGHSQGAALLKVLIADTIDQSPAERKLLVSAILLGGNVLVPEGASVGGSFQNVPTCASAVQTGCVIAYSSFAKEPPANSFFGRPGSSLLESTAPPPIGDEVVCVNPTLLAQDGEAGALLPYAPSTPFPGVLGAGTPTPEVPTPWATSTGALTAQCKHENGATWLQISEAPGVSEAQLQEREAHHEVPVELIGPEWGLHLYDVNIAIGNLVNTVALQSAAYRFNG